MDRMNTYIAVIGDLVKSRRLRDRQGVQLKLTEALHEINRSQYKKTIRSQFVVTLGDEFQGLVSGEFPLQTFLDQYESFFPKGVETRFGIGLGELSTELKKQAIGMDGACFHHARNALASAKKEHHTIVFSGFETDTALNALIRLILEIKGHWTNRQKEVLALYRPLQDQAGVARALNISRQAVHSIFKASRYESYQLGWDGITQLLTFSRS
ncbi:hypothetical protein JXO59_09865 [candidate division KSB1 bacterium]|nr:hypothetical protein [candidate division KSB1 bacterium]